MSSTEGHLDIPEGKIFWALDSPTKSSASPATSPNSTRPLLLFVHAGVADHTLWDRQIAYFVPRGWTVCRFDMLGYGKSVPSDIYLQQPSRSQVLHHDYFAALVREIQKHGKSDENTDRPQANKAVIIGLSRGGSHAVDFAIAYPGLCAGLAIVAGGLSGYYPPNSAEEDALLEKEAEITAAKDLDAAVDFNIHFWGDGPLQTPGRASLEVREKLRHWCRDNIGREMNGTGGFAIPFASVTPSATERLDEIRCPIAVGIGLFDEQTTTKSMRYIIEHSKHVTSTHEFETAHMINLEAESQFNEWLDEWLQAFL